MAWHALDRVLDVMLGTGMKSESEIVEQVISELNVFRLEIPENAGAEFLQKLIDQVKNLKQIVTETKDKTPCYVFSKDVGVKEKDVDLLRVIQTKDAVHPDKRVWNSMHRCSGVTMDCMDLSSLQNNLGTNKYYNGDVEKCQKMNSLLKKWYIESISSHISGLDVDVWKCILPLINTDVRCNAYKSSIDHDTVEEQHFLISMWLNPGVIRRLNIILQSLQPFSDFKQVTGAAAGT